MEALGKVYGIVKRQAGAVVISAVLCLEMWFWRSPKNPGAKQRDDPTSVSLKE